MNAFLEVTAQIDQRLVLLCLLIILDLWAITLVFLTRTASRREKLLWTCVIVLCPIVGCLLWFVFGPKPHRDAEPAN